MKIIIHILFLVLLFVIVSPSMAQDSLLKKVNYVEVELADEAAIILEGNTVTISDAIKKAIESNIDILTGKYDVAMADSEYQKFLTKYSPALVFESGMTSEKYPEVMWIRYGESSKSIHGSSSIAKSFSTGTSISAGIKYTYLNIKYPYANIDDNFHNTIYFVSIEQELLKNAFGYNDIKQMEILKKSYAMKKDSIIYNLSLIIVSVIVDYWNVVVAKTSVDNALLQLQETKRVRGIVYDNIKLGISEQFELNFWNMRVASSEAYLANVQQKYRDAFRKFMQKINMESAITLEDKVVLSNKVPNINLDESLKTAYAKRADYLNALRALEIAKNTLDIYENEALPSLKASFSVSSLDYNKSYNTAYNNTLNAKYPSYEAKITITYPLDNKEQKINERNAVWMVEQAKNQLEKYQRIVKDDVVSKYENIYTSYELYNKARESRVQAEFYYNKMLENLKRGRFNAASVREALDSLINSRERELQLLVAYNASLLEFEVAKNELFDTYKIDVEKYIPKEK